MANRVFLHLGLPKTGTTFLQTTMWSNRSQLRRQGVLYPGDDRNDHFQAFQQIRGAPKRGANAWDRVVGDLRAWDRDGFVSHEFFCLATRAQARRIVADLQPAQVDVVVTVRSYALQFPALWQEALKMNYNGGFDEFMREAFADRRTGAWGWSSQELPVILDRWNKIVPPERIHIVTVPPPGGPRGLLWERWCQTLGLDDSNFDLDVAHPNESLGAQQAALMRRVKPFLSGPLLDSGNQHRWVRRYFGHEVLVPQAGSRFSVGPEYADELRERSLDTIDAIRGGGYDVIGDLADLEATAPVMEGPHPDQVSNEEMLDVSARAIDRMIQDMREMTLQRNRWRARAKSKGLRGRLRKALRGDAS